MMESMGYVWNGKSWGRGNPKANKAFARSGNRFVRFVDAAETSEPATSPAAVAAAKRLGEVLQTAREEALPYTDTEQARDRDWKSLLAAAPAVWVAGQALAFLTLCSLGGLDLSYELDRCSPLSIGVGVLAGFAVAECRARSRRLQPGVEESDGAIERIVADSTDGNFALPAPAHVRASSDTWIALALAAELIAALNVTLALNAVAQLYLIRATSGALVWRLVDLTSGTPLNEYIALLGAGGAAVAVSLPSFLRAAQRAADPLDGAIAECEAAERAKRGAGAYFNMRPPKDADANQAAGALVALADGWVEKFGGVGEEPWWKEPMFAFGGSLACAAAWQISGGTVVVPFVARAVGVVDTYVVRPDSEASRVSVPLPENLDDDS